jgi:glycosyltransferase involved in cell wall biosynthesis
MYPEISVVIPAYNAERFIASAIDSVLSQTVSPMEIIVVDDGSRDNTRLIVERYNDTVKYFHQTNAGPSAARNRGVREARGEWIAFLDSDDYWDKNHLDLLLKNAQDHPDGVLIYCGKKWVDKDGNSLSSELKQTTFPSGWIFNNMFAANYINTASVVLVKRSVFIDLGGFDEQLRIAEDYDLWLRISAVAPIYGVSAYTLNYRRHDCNLTLQFDKQYKADLIILKKAQTMIKNNMVASQNNPDQIDIQKRMKQFYNDSAKGMFYRSYFKELRSLGLSAMKSQSITIPLMIRWLLSWLPDKVLCGMQRTYRNLK